MSVSDAQCHIKRKIQNFTFLNCKILQTLKNSLAFNTILKTKSPGTHYNKLTFMYIQSFGSAYCPEI
jgi:hypothetical protein